MRLWAITPGDGRDLTPWLRALGEAGLETVLIREKQRDGVGVAALVEVARRWVPEVRMHADCPGGVRLARRWGLPLHLSSREDAGQWRHRPLSQSCHSLAEVDRALAAGVEYCLLSPVYPPTSKPGDQRATLGVEGFLAVARERPVLALGGITPARARQLGTGVAVLGDLFGQPGPRAAAVRLRAYLSQS